MAPWALGRLYDEVFNEPAVHWRRVDARQPMSDAALVRLVAFCGLILLAQAAVLALGRARERVARRVQASLATEVRRELARKASRLPGRALLAASPGRIQGVFLGDVDVLEGLLFQGIETLLVAPVAFAGTLLVLFLLDVHLAAVTLLPLPFLVLATAARVARLCGLAEADRDAASEFTARSGTFLGSLLLARLYGREEREALRVGDAARDARLARLAAEDTLAAHLSFVAFLATLAGTGVLLYGGARVLELEVFPGVVLAFLGYSTTLYPSFMEVTRANFVLQNVAVAVTRVSPLLFAAEEPRNEGGPAPAEGPIGISLSGVRFAYEVGRDVLAGVDLEVPVASRVAISGPSGGGKTTLARVVVGLLTPDAGRVLVGGVDPTKADLTRLRRRVAMVSQEEMLPGETVAEVLRYAREEATEAEMREALRVAALPVEPGTAIGPRGWAMSGGERQRIAIARAVVARPSLLVLDEATSAVDIDTEAEVHRALSEALAGCTIVVITHRVGSVGWVDRHFMLHAGRLSA